MEIADRGRIDLRVYERGAGETLACGTGACAAVAVGRRRGLLDSEVQVGVRGGELPSWAGVGESIWLTGPAEVSFEGHLEVARGLEAHDDKKARRSSASADLEEESISGYLQRNPDSSATRECWRG